MPSRRSDSVVIALGEGRTITLGELRRSNEPVHLRNGSVVSGGKVLRVCERLVSWLTLMGNGDKSELLGSLLVTCQKLKRLRQGELPKEQVKFPGGTSFVLCYLGAIETQDGREVTDQGVLDVILSFIKKEDERYSLHKHPIAEDDDGDGERLPVPEDGEGAPRPESGPSSHEPDGHPREGRPLEPESILGSLDRTDIFQ